MQNAQEQRRYPRVNCAGEAEVGLPGAYLRFPARVEELSEQGCRILPEHGSDFALGTILELAFTVHGLPFRVRAEIRSVRHAGTLGLEFVQLSPRSRTHLRDLVQELASQRPR